MTGWSGDLADWWIGEAAADPAYVTQVLPLALAMLDPHPGGRYLDLGCGAGPLLREMALAGTTAVGVDGSESLAGRAADHAPTVVGTLPELGFIGDETVDGTALVLVLEHVGDAARLFVEAHRVTRPGGVLAVVVNHPLLTAPASGPFVDPDDGEVLWRWGTYLSGTHTDEPAGENTVRFHHRSMSVLLSAAAAAGWVLQKVAEVGHDHSGADPLLAAQSEVPRLLGARWVRPTDR